MEGFLIVKIKKAIGPQMKSSAYSLALLQFIHVRLMGSSLVVANHKNILPHVRYMSMAWRTVLINSHAKINYSANQIQVQTDSEKSIIPIEDIQVLIVGTTRAVITAYAIKELAKRHVKVIFSDENGMPVGEFLSHHDNVRQNYAIRKQFAWGDNRKQRLWQRIVEVKLDNQLATLEKLTQEDIQGMVAARQAIEFGDSTNREAVAARVYFVRMFGADFARSNPELSINAKLNYGYAILLSFVSREITGFGYLTQLGIHHDSWENAFNLASDLMEPFRPLVDAVALEQGDGPFELEQKIEFVEILNQEIFFNEKSMVVTQAISEVVRQSLAFMSDELEDAPEWRFEI
jgi:CRISPR-associated protein Cas1